MKAVKIKIEKEIYRGSTSTNRGEKVQTHDNFRLEKVSSFLFHKSVQDILPIINGIEQCYVPSLTFYLIFNSDLCKTVILIHSFADNDSTLPTSATDD